METSLKFAGSYDWAYVHSREHVFFDGDVIIAKEDDKMYIKVGEDWELVEVEKHESNQPTVGVAIEGIT